MDFVIFLGILEILIDLVSVVILVVLGIVESLVL